METNHEQETRRQATKHHTENEQRQIYRSMYKHEHDRKVRPVISTTIHGRWLSSRFQRSTKSLRNRPSTPLNNNTRPGLPNIRQELHLHTTDEGDEDEERTHVYLRNDWGHPDIMHHRERFSQPICCRVGEREREMAVFAIEWRHIQTIFQNKIHNKYGHHEKSNGKIKNTTKSSRTATDTIEIFLF